MNMEKRDIVPFLSRFPEDLFYCDDVEYNTSIQVGLAKASQSKLHIMGLARDCERALFLNMMRIDRLRKSFAKTSIFILENDSIDRTKDVLSKWSWLPNSSFSSINEGKVKHPQNKSRPRMADMAHYRNICLNSIPDCDYVMIYDFDIIGGFSYDGIFNSLSLDEDVVGANSLIVKDGQLQYYDSYALRFPSYVSDEDKNKLAFKRGDTPIKVNSVFGGLALYKRECLENIQYEDWDCEHVTLHSRLLHNNYNIVLNPNLITFYNETRYTKLL